jgi:hypothetical protein
VIAVTMRAVMRTVKLRQPQVGGLKPLIFCIDHCCFLTC